MGKNQTYKAMQRAKASSRGPSAGPGEDEVRDGKMDGTFHSPAWHAARLAALQTSNTLTWEEWKAQRKEEARKQQEADGFEEKRMREFREQLDKEREEKLARGRNHADKREKLKKKKKSKDKDKDKDKDKKSKKKKKKKGKRSRTESSDSESDTSSEDDVKKSKKRKTESDGDLSSASEEGEGGPVRLSSFFTGGDDDLPGSDKEDGPQVEGNKPVDLKALMDEAKRRAEIGQHMVAEVKKAEAANSQQSAQAVEAANIRALIVRAGLPT